MSGKPMTEEVTAQPLGVSQKQGSEEAAAGGAGRGEGAQWSGRCPRPSGLGDLLTSGRAGREPGGGALLRAEAVLVLFFNFCQGFDGDSQEIKGLHTFWNTGKLL